MKKDKTPKEPVILYLCCQQKVCRGSISCGVDCVLTGDLLYSNNYREVPDRETLKKNFKKFGKGIWIEKHGSD